MSRSSLTRAALAAAFLSIGAGAFTSAQAQSAMPAWKGEGATRYVCGGIGSDESNAMRAAMKEHPLALLFARADGAYLADLQVEIKGRMAPPRCRCAPRGRCAWSTFPRAATRWSRPPRAASRRARPSRSAAARRPRASGIERQAEAASAASMSRESEAGVSSGA